METIQAIFFADTHLGYDYPLKPRTERKRRGEDFFANFHLILDEAIRTKPDFVIHGGDVFDSPYVNESLINLAYDKFFELAECGIPVFIVPGNHEKAKLLPTIFLQHPLIHIFSKPKTFRLICKGQTVNISGFPYYYDGIRKDFQALVKMLTHEIKDNTLKIMCMHQLLESAQVGVQNYTFKANKDAIKVSDLTDKFDCYLSGHIHRYQLIKNSENNIPFLYPGSTERTSYQERNEIKGYCKISFKRTEKSFQMDHQFIKLKTRPLETLVFEDRIYSETEVKELIIKKVKQISSDSVLRYQSEFPENIYKINAKIESKLIPNSISIQKGYWTPGKGYKREKK